MYLPTDKAFQNPFIHKDALRKVGFYLAQWFWKKGIVFTFSLYMPLLISFWEYTWSFFRIKITLIFTKWCYVPAGLERGF